MPDPGEDAWDQLAARDIRVVSGVVRRLRGDGDALRAVVLDDGSEFAVDALTVALRFITRANLYEQLGGTLTEHPMGMFIETGPMGRTEISGVWTAGNGSDLGAMIAAATGGRGGGRRLHQRRSRGRGRRRRGSSANQALTDRRRVTAMP